MTVATQVLKCLGVETRRHGETTSLNVYSLQNVVAHNVEVQVQHATLLVHWKLYNAGQHGVLPH